MERVNLRKVDELEVRKRYQIEISHMFAALEKLNVSDDINRAWENIKGNIRISAIESLGLYELKHHKLWFDDECVRFLDERTQWLQVPNKVM